MPRRFTGFEAIPVPILVLVGETESSLARLTAAEPGTVFRLDRKVGEPFELRAGEVLLGRVELVAEKDGVAVKLVDSGEER